MQSGLVGTPGWWSGREPGGLAYVAVLSHTEIAARTGAPIGE